MHSICEITKERQWRYYHYIRVRISGSRFAKCESILSFCEASSLRNNRNAKLNISLLAPKFYFVIIIFYQDNLQKHLLTWHHLILQSKHQANLRAVYLTSFMFYVLNVLYFSFTLSCVTVKKQSSSQVLNNFFQSIFIDVK